jgi:hypothetical protein
LVASRATVSAEVAQALTPALALAGAVGEVVVSWAGDVLAEEDPPPEAVAVPHAAIRAAPQSSPAVAPPRRAVADGLIWNPPVLARVPNTAQQA